MTGNLILKQFCFDEKTFQVLADAIFLSEAGSLGTRVLLHQKNGCSAFFKMHRIMRRKCGKYLKDLRAAYINSLTQIVSSLIFVKKGAGSIIFSNYSEGLYEMTKEELGIYQ